MKERKCSKSYMSNDINTSEQPKDKEGKKCGRLLRLV